MRSNAKLFKVLVVAALAIGVLVVLGREGGIAGLERWWHRGDQAQIVLSGNIEAHDSQLSFKGVQSRIVQLPFNEGQWVRAGTVVAVVDSQDLKQQVTIAEAAGAVQQRQLEAAQQSLEAARRVIDADQAALAQRERDLKRSVDLQRQGFVSDAALDNARTALDEARAVLARDQALAAVAVRNIAVAQASTHSAGEALHMARLTEGYATLVAPFDGVILARQAELGEVVAPGTPIVTVADLDHVWVRAYLNETDLARVKLGQAARVTADGLPGKTIAGRVSFIASQAEYTPKSVETHAERVTLVYRIKVDIDNPDHLLVPGMPVDVTLEPAPR
jgi:HlyD family secretion protein